MDWASSRRTIGGVSRSEAAIAAPSGHGPMSPAANRALVAHRTSPATDGDKLVDAEHIGEGDNVIGAVLETEPQRRANAAAVAAVVEGDHAERW